MAYTPKKKLAAAEKPQKEFAKGVSVKVQETKYGDIIKDGLNVENIIEYVQNHYCEELNNTELSKIFHFHSNYINSEFKKHTGKSLHGYMLELRILKSISLIESGFTDISEIAYSCGFGDSNYFSRYFKKKTGISPIKYAKQQH